ncbi:MAG: hypothetical protein WKF89_12950 [Chitinophagaceae bacterium]
MKIYSTPNNDTVTAELHASQIVYGMKISLLLVLAILISILKGSSADTTRAIRKSNSVYVQVAGIGNKYSINCERVFFFGATINYSYSAGYAMGYKNFSFPFSLSAFTAGKTHHFGVSLAMIPYFEKHSFSKMDEDLDKQLYIKPGLGYRYQRSDKTFYFKVGAGPQIFIDPPSHNVWAFAPTLIAPSAQLAIGFSF